MRILELLTEDLLEAEAWQTKKGKNKKQPMKTKKF